MLILWSTKFIRVASGNSISTIAQINRPSRDGIWVCDADAYKWFEDGQEM